MNKAARRKAVRINVQAAELMFAAPQVIAHRLTRMRAPGAGSSVRDQREFRLMSSEKAAAFGESWNAMAWQMLRTNQQMTRAWLSAWALPLRAPASTTSRRNLIRAATQMQSATLKVLASGLAPVHRRATANAKRLGRSKVR